MFAEGLTTMTGPVSQLRGYDGELVARLVELCRGAPDEGRWAVDNLTRLAGEVAIGLHDEVPIPVAELDRAAEELRLHLMKFVELGLRENTLVSAVLDRFDAWHRDLADAAAVESKRVELRAFIEHVRDNPVDYLGQLGQTPDEVVRSSERVLELVHPSDSDESVKRLSGVAEWQRRREGWLSKDVFEAWEELYPRRLAEKTRGESADEPRPPR